MRLLAALLSLVVPGLGHAVIGRTARGFLWLTLLVVALVLILPVGVWAVVASFAVRPAAAVDALFATRRPGSGREALIIIGFIAAGFGAHLGVRAFVVEAFKIPSAAMLPTLEIGDHIFVNKFLYGLRIPFTKVRIIEWRKPQHGEMIVFIYPRDTSIDFIKRIVALDGETIEVRNDIVYVNGEPIPHEDEPGAYEFWDYKEETDRWFKGVGRRTVETWGGERYTTLHHLGPVGDHDMAPFRVPPGHVFVLGDNRDNSSDSRMWGPLPLENIKGKAAFVWWSSGEPAGIRWNRIGRSL